MNLWERYAERRRQKNQQRVGAEKARQRELGKQDAQQAVRGAANSSGAAQQGMYGHGT
jgi:hypothetical protein